MTLILKVAKLVAPAAFVLGVSVTPSWAITTTFKATIENVTGSSVLLNDLGIVSGDHLTALFSFDTDQSDGAIFTSDPYRDQNSKANTYESFSLNTPNYNIDAPSSDGSNNYVFTLDGTSETGGDYAYDYFEIRSILPSSDNSTYLIFLLRSYNYDENIWNREDPITAGILNALGGDYFRYEKEIDGKYYGIQSYSIAYSEISNVPLPTSLALSLSGFGLLFGIGRYRRRA